jgi:hypothetical protein
MNNHISAQVCADATKASHAKAPPVAKAVARKTRGIAKKAWDGYVWALCPYDRRHAAPDM